MVLTGCLVLPLMGANVATHKSKPPAPVAAAPAVKGNPLLPPAIPIESFFIDLSLVQKVPVITPAGFDPPYTASDWQAYRNQFGTEADAVTKLKSTGVAAFADELLKASESAATPGLKRLLLLRAAAVGYRNKDGFPVADKAVAAFLNVMDKTSPSQVGALWTIGNTMARTSVTPKDDRIRYDAIAARANMKLALLMLDADQVAAAEAMIHQIAYHEGWLKKDPAIRAQIAQVRAEVKQVAAMMDYLATQYEPAIQNNLPALTAVYLYGRYVKANPSIVADLPGRVPGSSLDRLASLLDAAESGGGRADPSKAFAAAEELRAVAVKIPDALLRQRTLYAALQLYDAYMASPQTERERVNRTLARIAREGVISDGARKGHVLDPFAAAATAPAVAAEKPGEQVFNLPAEDVPSLEAAIGDEPWLRDAIGAAQAAVAEVGQQEKVSPALRQKLMGLAEVPPEVKVLSPGAREAEWDNAGLRVAVMLENSRPAEEDKGIWLARRVTVKPE